jgi:hypothetical protein
MKVSPGRAGSDLACSLVHAKCGRHNSVVFIQCIW